MTAMRAKMVVDAVEKYRSATNEVQQEDVFFRAVTKSVDFGAQGESENNTYARWTPMANAKFCVQNPGLFGKFSIGQEFYVDFTPAA